VANALKSSGLGRLAGKIIVFSGKFSRDDHEDVLRSRAEVLQANIADELDASTNIVVVPDLPGTKSLQKTVASLNAGGAQIKMVDPLGFSGMVLPTRDELLGFIRTGTAAAATFAKAVCRPSDRGHGYRGGDVLATFTGEQFDGLDLTGFNFGGIDFKSCSFVGARIGNTRFPHAVDCDFSKATGSEVKFDVVDRSRFVGAKLERLIIDAHLDGCDFTDARINGAELHEWFFNADTEARPAKTGPVMTNAKLQAAVFCNLNLNRPNFDGADLSGASFVRSRLKSSTFVGAVLCDGHLVGNDLNDADFTNADLSRVNLAESDLTAAVLKNANLDGANLSDAVMSVKSLSQAKNANQTVAVTTAKGPALAALNAVADTATKLTISFEMGRSANSDGIGLEFNSFIGSKGTSNTALLFVRALRNRVDPRNRRGASLAEIMIQGAHVFGHLELRFETLEVSGSKSPKSQKELRELAINAIAEAFAQPIPAAAELTSATKAFRARAREQDSAEKMRREVVKKNTDEQNRLAEKQKQTAKRQIAKKIEKEVGKVTDIATFLKALELRADKSKIDKATKMLKAEKFQLFNDITEAHLNGVVKSQTDADLVYACRIESNGQYACCTQNLNICGGLRGSICKHLLVLIIGLVKAGQLDPSDIDGWIAKTHDTKPELNKETMGEIFIRYKGAEAGEVDWRPTETVPEDYYAV
jgi:uncharacterized protein YjbI with pentapeptide repeats